ncbi:MAG TPA: hypothetical protein VF168_04860 [Trueperaceae bacterium]
MRPQNFSLFFLAAGVAAAVALTRKGHHQQMSAPTNRAPRLAPRRFILAKDVPSLDLRRGERLLVDPDALIYVGDVVALKSDEPEVVLARFHDELMHCVDGLVIRETQAHPSV